MLRFGAVRYELMEESSRQDSRDGIDGKAVQCFQKSFGEVQNLLDQNRVLINEINQNHESKMPHNLSRNVSLIRELNNNIRRVVDLYADISTSLALSSADPLSSEGASRSDANRAAPGHKRLRP